MPTAVMRGNRAPPHRRYLASLPVQRGTWIGINLTRTGDVIGVELTIARPRSASLIRGVEPNEAVPLAEALANAADEAVGYGHWT